MATTKNSRMGYMATTNSPRVGSRVRAVSPATASALLKRKLRTGGEIRVAGVGLFKIFRQRQKKKGAGIRIEFVTSEDGALRLLRAADKPRAKAVKKVKMVKPSDQEHLKQMAEIVDLVSNWAGGKEQALAWYRAAQIPEFGDRTAEALVKDGLAMSVREYVDHVALGGFA